MEYETNRVERPPGMTTECLLVEGTIQLAGYDADLNIVFPGGQKAILQWRVDGPTLDLCFDNPVDVFNDAADMQPAPAQIGRPEHHADVVQLVIPLPPEYGESKRPADETSGMGQRTKDGGCQHCANETMAELPYSVGLANESGSVMGRFATEEEASGFIDTLPDHEDGQYYLDGPPDDIQEEATS